MNISQVGFFEPSSLFEAGMSDPTSIFRSLTAGINFDKKRFRPEAEKFGLTSKKTESELVQREVFSLPELPTDFHVDGNDDEDTDDGSSDVEELKLLGKLGLGLPSVL